MISEYYVETAQDEFGTMFDYVLNDCDIDIVEFQKMFLNSSIIKQIENNDFLLISGKSGVELANMIIPKNKQTRPSYPITYRTKEYWLGWALVYFWMNSIYSFKNIIDRIPFDNILSMYIPYHEMDISAFSEEMQRIMETNRLKEYRIKANLSQSQLSTLSNVSIKTIQKYERKERVLSKANVDILLRLSKVLNCPIESLII